MKKSLKLLLAIGALTAAASPSFADVYLPATDGTIGNGELVLYVRNNTDGTTYARGLGARIDDILTQQEVAGTAYTGTTATYSVNVTDFSLGTIVHDTNLTSFLAAGVGDEIVWGVVGGTGNDGTNTLGAARYATTTAAILGANAAGTQGNSATNNQIKSIYSALDGQLNALNSLIPGTTLGDGSSTPSDSWSGSYDNSWYGAGPTLGTALSGTANFYLVSTNGLGNTTRSRVFTLFDLTLEANGDLVMQPVSQVPLPAAVWLLGSGLLGFLGIGRRKVVA